MEDHKTDQQLGECQYAGKCVQLLGKRSLDISDEDGGYCTLKPCLPAHMLLLERGIENKNMEVAIFEEP